MIGEQEFNLFSVPFKIFNLGEQSRELNKQLISDILEEKEKNNNQVRTGINVWQSHADLETKYDSFNQLRKTFSDLTFPFLSKIGFKGDIASYVRCEDFWANVNDNPYAYHVPHMHGYGNTIFTGVYYPSSGLQDNINISDKQNLDLDPIDFYSSSYPKPGSIVFSDPAVSIKRQVKRNQIQSYPYFGLDMCLTPREGVMVVFPHYLMHSVTPTEKHGFTRISIAFNFNFID